jgi:arginine repressor|tara:strand:- start:16 stop:327 length:312 start_codon:yes stop_codon:yes gene_type:complete
MSKVSVNGIIRDATAEEQAEINARNTEWNNSSVSRKLEKIKQIRLEKLIETDWWVLRGNMTDAQTQYRQKLRDIPADYDSSKYDELLATGSDGKLTHSVWSKP